MVRIGKALLAGVFGAVAIMLFVAPLVVRFDTRALSPGDDASCLHYTHCVVESISEDGKTVVLTTSNAGRVTVPRSKVIER